MVPFYAIRLRYGLSGRLESVLPLPTPLSPGDRGIILDVPLSSGVLGVLAGGATTRMFTGGFRFSVLGAGGVLLITGGGSNTGRGGVGGGGTDRGAGCLFVGRAGGGAGKELCSAGCGGRECGREEAV